MIKTLVNHGNSSALIIDKPILELLHIKQDTLLEIITDGENLIISPVNDKAHHSKINSSLQKYNKRFEKTLKKLAE